MSAADDAEMVDESGKDKSTSLTDNPQTDKETLSSHTVTDTPISDKDAPSSTEIVEVAADAAEDKDATEFKSPDSFKHLSLTANTKPDPEVEAEKKEKISAKVKPVKSPADNLKPAPPLPYKEPTWSGVSSSPYTLEVIKNGVPVSEIRLSTKAFWVVGRLPQCDVPMEHPSLSRYHAIVQYCNIPTDTQQVGWYIYDLGSTHGTIVNKQRITPNVYHRLRVGHTFKFGGSTRLHILQGPEEDQDNELTPEDLSALREKRKAQLEEKLRQKSEATQEQETDGGGGGCSWGMDDDAEDVDPAAPNPYSTDSVVIAEELQLDDPKKTLRGWYEREGYDEPEYIIEEASHGRYRCTVDLPADTPTGHPLKAEVSVQGKKKEAVVQCALEACRLLDKLGVLRQAKHESRKRKTRNWDDNDYYDSDEDIYLDRTGDIEKKRQLRMKRAGKLESDKQKSALTYEQLVIQLEKIDTEMSDIQSKVDRTKQLEKNRSEDMDDLDAYMLSIKSGGMNATEKTQCKRRLIELKQDKLRTEKLINIAKPNSLPTVRRQSKTPAAVITQRDVRRRSVEEERVRDKPADSTTTDRCDVREETESTLQSPTGESEKISTHEIDPSSEKTIEKKTPPSGDSKPCGDKPQPSVMSSQQSMMSSQQTVTIQEKNRDSDKMEFSSPAHLNVKDKSSSKKNKKRDRTSQGSEVSKSGGQKGGSLSNMVSDLKQKAEVELLQNDPDFSGWLPPKDQSGDGRTSLNDKLGY